MRPSPLTARPTKRWLSGDGRLLCCLAHSSVRSACRRPVELRPAGWGLTAEPERGREQQDCAAIGLRPWWLALARHSSWQTAGECRQGRCRCAGIQTSGFVLPARSKRRLPTCAASNRQPIKPTRPPWGDQRTLQLPRPVSSRGLGAAPHRGPVGIPEGRCSPTPLSLASSPSPPVRPEATSGHCRRRDPRASPGRGRQPTGAADSSRPCVPPRVVCPGNLAASWVAALAATAGPAFGRPRGRKPAGEASVLAGQRRRQF